MFLFSVAACATTNNRPAANDARLARLPPQQRAALIDQKREIDVAEANLEAARVALRDAEDWRGIVHRERAAADERLNAARDELDLARRTAAGSGQVGAAQRKLTIAQRRQGAALAKLDSASRLVRLRHDELALRQVQLDWVRARSELAEVDELHDVGRGADLRRSQFASARDDAQTRVISRQREVDTGRGAVEAARVRWEQMYRSYDTAMRSVGHAMPGAPPASSSSTKTRRPVPCCPSTSALTKTTRAHPSLSGVRPWARRARTN